MIRLKDSYWAPVYVELEGFLWRELFGPIFKASDLDKPKTNALVQVNAPELLKAIREGRIFYDNGVFSGSFDARTVRELEQFATRSGKSWVGVPPPEVSAGAAEIRYRAQALNARVAQLLPSLETRMTEAIRSLTIPIAPLVKTLAGEAADSVRGLAVMPEYTPGAVERLAREYNDAQRFNITNWAPEQMARLREVIERNVQSGYNPKELQELILTEWNVSANKARFLARQETSLFVSKIRDERYQSAGVEEYIWMSSNDARCREANKYGGPSHGPGGPLHGKRFRFDSPPVSGTKGERENPGVPYGCRCIARPVLASR